MNILKEIIKRIFYFNFLKKMTTIEETTNINCKNCLWCYCCKNCEDCTNCINCENLKNKNNYINNK